MNYFGDASCNEACEEYKTALFTAAKAELELRTRTRADAFAWHHTSTISIFFLVNLIVLSGLYLSYLEFRKGSIKIVPASIRTVTNDNNAVGEPASDTAPATTLAQGMPPASSTFKAGLDGVEFTSSLIGLMIFVASISFFYLYLEYVYEIKLVSADAVTISGEIE